jgi:hypothetical protein
MSALDLGWSEHGVGSAMKARAIIEGAAYGPDDLKATGQAFDEAWEEIAHHYKDNVLRAELARMRLANIVLEVSDNQRKDATKIKQLALKVMELRHPATTAKVG